MSQSMERRNHPRAKRLLRFEFTSDGRTVRALSSNVCSTGAFLCAGTLPSLGSEIFLRFASSPDPRQAVLVKSRVIRCVESPDGSQPNRGFAVRWLEATTTGDEEAIRSFLTQFPDDAGGHGVPNPSRGDLSVRFRYDFPQPAAGATDGEDGAFPMGPEGISGPVELSLDDFLRQEDLEEDDDEPGPPTVPVDLTPEHFAQFSNDEDPFSEEALFVGRPTSAPLQPLRQFTPPEMPAVRPPTGPVRSVVAVPEVEPTPPPRTPPPHAPPSRDERVPSDEAVGSGLVAATMPVRLEWAGQGQDAQTLHLTQTQITVTMNGPPPSIYARASLVFPGKGGRRKAAHCALWVNVTRVRNSAHGSGVGGLVSLGLAMQNEPSELRAYRKILKKAEKASRRS